jgi:ankyrin repeat protein
MSLDNQLIQLVNDAIFANPDKDVSQDLLQVKSLGRLLKFSSVDLAATDNDKVSLLHKFAFHRYYPSATFLISHGASASLKDGKGRTPAHYLVAPGEYEEDDAEEEKDRGEENKDEEEFGKKDLALLKLMLQNGDKLLDKDANGGTVAELLEKRLPVWVQLERLLDGRRI